MKDFRRPSILEVNFIYLVLAFALIFIGSLVQKREVYSGLLVTEYILILSPNILYLKLRGYSFKNVFRLNSIKFKQFVYIFFIMIFSYPIAVFLNMIFVMIINTFSNTIPTTVPIPTDMKSFMFSFFVIAITPGICEEIMFRGTILSAYERKGKFKAVLISALLFGIFHFNLFNFAGPTFLGIILGVLTIKTNSIFSSILGHIINNTIALTIGYYFTKLSGELEILEQSTPIYPEYIQIIVSLVTVGLFALISLIIVLTLIRKMPTTMEVQEKGSTHMREETENELVYLPLLVVIIFFIIYNYLLLV